MAILQLPITSDGYPDYLFTVGLEGVNYTFHLCWNDRADAWYLDILSPDLVPLLTSIRVVTNWSLNRNFKGSYTDTLPYNTSLPPGYLFCGDTTGQDTDPDQSALGTTHFLYYAESTGASS